MDYWKTEASPIQVASLLETPMTSGAIDIREDWCVGVMEPLDDPVIDELVEALFLEERRSIVVFGTPHAEEIALRLMTALWPSMRRNLKRLHVRVVAENSVREVV